MILIAVSSDVYTPIVNDPGNSGQYMHTLSVIDPDISKQ